MAALQRNDFAHEAHRRFIERAVAAACVWGLHREDGWAVADSNRDEGRSVMPFWSDAAYARRCIHGAWMDYAPTRIPLDKFLAVWLPGLDQKGHFVGTNWDQSACGVEVYPLALKQQIEEELGRRGAVPPL
jgi:hypothetical protein